MWEIFSGAFTGTFMAVAKVFLVALAAGILLRRRIISQEHINSLSAVTVNVFLPCMIFAKITRSFDPQEMSIWWVLPLSAVLMIIPGLGLGYLVFRRRGLEGRPLIALSALQNAGYLVLPVGQLLYPQEFDRFATYVFLYILAGSPLLWSVGKFLATTRVGKRTGWRGLITPPFVANILGLTLAFLGLGRRLPSILIEPVALLGEAAVPVANFILGAVLGGISLHWRRHGRDGLEVMAIKMFLLPALTVLVLHVLGLREQWPLLTNMLVLQGAAAPATALILQVRNYGGDEEKVSNVMLLCYVVCLVTMPLWLAVWGSLARL